ncbi:MAG: FAD-dependent oxidoreductase [Piscinibacter sp.]
MAGELADFLAGARRYYPRVHADELRVTLLQDAERLLLELPAALGHAAAASLRARGVDVRLGSRAAQVDGDGVTLADGTRLESATLICTIGTRANPLAERLGVTLQRGRIETAADLSVPAAPGVWAIGDCALVRNHAGDRHRPAEAGPAVPASFAPPTAQFAVAQAQALAHNLLARDRRPADASASPTPRAE